MRATWLSIVALMVLLCVAGERDPRGHGKPPPPQPEPLVAGPGQSLATPCAAIAAAVANQEIEILPGTYTDSCEINTPGLWLKGVNGQPKIDLSGTNHPADYKGIFVVSADNVTIQNLELTGAHVDDSEGGNAAALRVTGHGLVVDGCSIHDNQNGILAAPNVDGGTITIEYTEFAHNGLGDACDQGGCVHNVYISKSSSTVRYDQTIFQFNWSHDLASDTADKGHLFKSRSRRTDVLYNRITGETGHDSYEVDLPNGGLGFVVGNVIEKGPDADNSILLSYGEEGIDNPSTDLYVASNTFVNDFTGGTFIQVASGGTLTAHNNIFAGPGTLSNVGTLPVDDMSGVDPLFVAPATYDYHLQAGSPARGKAVLVAAVGSVPLTPSYEYVQPLLSVPRLASADLGAFEYGTVTSGPGIDGGFPVLDPGLVQQPPPTLLDAGVPGDAATGGALPDASTSTGSGAGGVSQRATAGCACDSGGRRSRGAGGLAGAAFAAMLALRRRRRAFA
jgi:hypothetical protein